MKPSADFASLTLPSAPDWPSERQRAFLIAFACTGDVAVAARQVGATETAPRNLRRALAKNSNFARAWGRASTEAKFDAIAIRILRYQGLSADQLTRVDAACHGSDKARLTLDLLRRSSGFHTFGRPK